MITRRRFIQGVGVVGAAAMAGMPRIGFGATAVPDRLFVVVTLRGGMDGLSAVPAHADPDYRAMRGELALPAPGQPNGIVDLDGMFGLHPALAELAPYYRAGALLPVHATATPYDRRSHFDAENVLDSGWDTPSVSHDGWLNRALGTMGPDAGDRAIAVARQVPLLLRGDVSVGHWRPSGFPAVSDERMARLMGMFGPDSELHAAMKSGLATRDIARRAVPAEMSDEVANTGEDAWLAPMARVAASMLTADRGINVAVLDGGGWDTHSRQGALEGRLPPRLQDLGAGLVALEKGLGPHWRKTVVLVVTEFGRTVRPNGSGGTDHGTATVALLAGGALAGGRVHADWPGLAETSLRDGRDLRPTTDLRAVIKGLLRDHLQMRETVLAETVFPGSAGVRPLDGLIRA